MPSLQDCKLAFIGGGNMASAIIGGLVAQGVPKNNVHVAEPWDVNREKIAAMGVRTTTDNLEAGADADVVVVAVKPQIVQTVCEQFAQAWRGREKLPVVVSIAAGVGIESMLGWLAAPGGSSGKAPRVVRVMPNTPALVGEGASGVAASESVTAEDKELVDALFKGLSPATEWVSREELLDVVTGLSGSGPAYFFAMVEHLIDAATDLGLPREQATRLATQTCLGAGKMLVQSPESPTQLRKNVTSPNGTTFAGLQALENKDFNGTLKGAVQSAASRGAELGREFK